VDAVDFRNTVPFNTYGLPAISIPCGYTEQMEYLSGKGPFRRETAAVKNR